MTTKPRDIITTQRLGSIRVVENAYISIQVGFSKRELSPELHPIEARALAHMLTTAARRVESKRKTVQS